MPIICIQSLENTEVWICTSEADLLDCDYVFCNQLILYWIKIVIVQSPWSKEQGVIFHSETLKQTQTNHLVAFIAVLYVAT